MDDLRESKDEARCWHFNGEIDSDDVISTLTSVPGRPVLHLDQYKLIPVLTVAEQVLTSSELRNTVCRLRCNFHPIPSPFQEEVLGNGSGFVAC